MPISINDLIGGDKIRIVLNTPKKRKRRFDSDLERGGVENPRGFQNTRNREAYRIAAASSRYLILYKKHRPSNKRPIAVIDRITLKFGAHNKKPGTYDLSTYGGALELLDDLEAGRAKLQKFSRRIRNNDLAGPIPGPKQYRWQKWGMN